MVQSTRRALSSVGGNPFALGALAAVVGIVAGSLFKTSDGEQAALGSVATKVRTAGSDLAQDIVDKGVHVASDTLDAVKDSANAHGLNADRPIGELMADAKSGDLFSGVKQVAHESLDAGNDAVRTHFASGDKPAHG